MRYALIREMDISNGEGIGVSLFVQGCHFHCKGCFNQETWDFNGGKEWTEEIENKFFELVNRPYVRRISILGGEPLADENVDGVLNLILKLKQKYPFKKIWLYTGYTYEAIKEKEYDSGAHLSRGIILDTVDVLVDGTYIKEQRDITLSFRGSRNQRIWKKGEDGLWNIDTMM